MLSLDDRRLGWLLGLGDILAAPICHGYQNGCLCDECRDRASLDKHEPAPQPWERKAA